MNQKRITEVLDLPDQVLERMQEKGKKIHDILGLETEDSVKEAIGIVQVLLCGLLETFAVEPISEMDSICITLKENMKRAVKRRYQNDNNSDRPL